MADDPHRDLLPVKEGSCVNTCRSSVIVARERHTVCKLDRYELEDRYLRLLDEVQDLKKLSNIQEDKIKRLATKLMRVAATPRSCLQTPLDFNDGNRVDSLERENAKLKDKITVLRNQILNHKFGRSRSRRLDVSSSGPTTFRSEIGRIRSETSHLIRDIEDEKNERNNLARIEELELQKKDLTSRIEELECQLENHRVGKQREKAAENVEFIRVWRQMKQQSEQLSSAQSVNASLSAEIQELKKLLEEKTRNIREVTGALTAEKKKLSDLDEQLATAKNSQLSLREKDERIKDLTSEMTIMRQHNEELIALSSRYSQVERENVDLRRKISEQLSDHQSLKSAFSNEQANMTALQAANEKLMAKLHELQRNIDSLTIQLKSFQFQNERRDRHEPEIRIVRTMDRGTSTNSLPEKLVAASPPPPPSPEEKIPALIRNTVDREMQTDPVDPVDARRQEQQSPRRSAVLESPKRSAVIESPKRSAVMESPIRDDRSFQPSNGTASLKPEEMLKLLEQAQINVPLDVHNAAKMRQIAATLPTEYLNSTEPRQRQTSRQSDSVPAGRESAVDSYLSTSLEQSDSSVIRAMEDEDATSEEIRAAGKKRQISSTEKMIRNVEVGYMEDVTENVDSESVTEFNSLIRNNTISSPRDSSSSVQDLGTVFSDDNWHEYKRRSMASQARTSKPSIASADRSGPSYLTDRPSGNNSTVIIRIESLTLDEKSPLIDDPEIHQLYVEFSFLGYDGADLETVSVPKPLANVAAYFNYMRKFEIDEDKHPDQRNALREMMTDDNECPNVRFTVVSEPLPAEMDTKECREVGYADLNIREHVLSGGSNEAMLRIVNDQQKEPMGFLKITLLGVEAIRRCFSDLE